MMGIKILSSDEEDEGQAPEDARIAHQQNTKYVYTDILIDGKPRFKS